MGYAGRVVDDKSVSEDNPRYRFPGKREREGKLYEFRKTLFLYNGFRIKAPVNDLVVVEGFASVWWFDQNHQPNVVATMGSDCSDKQAELIVSLVKPAGRIWIIPDDDPAGGRFIEAALLKLSPHRFVRWVKLDRGRQPTNMRREEILGLVDASKTTDMVGSSTRMGARVMGSIRHVIMSPMSASSMPTTATISPAWAS